MTSPSPAIGAADDDAQQTSTAEPLFWARVRTSPPPMFSLSTLKRYTDSSERSRNDANDASCPDPVAADCSRAKWGVRDSPEPGVQASLFASRHASTCPCG